MGEQKFAGHGIVRAAAIIAFTGLVAACSSGPPIPAPVVLKGAAPGFAGSASIVPAPIVRAPAVRTSAAPTTTAPRTIVVQHGQSVGLIARAYHAPVREIIAANRLTPPYKIETGQRLLIPGIGAPVQPMLAGPTPTPPIAVAHATPDIIPLDGPAPAPPIVPPGPVQRPPGAASLTPHSVSAAASKPPSEPSAAEEAHTEANARSPRPSMALPHGGHFPWPVRGHVVGGYGVAASGSHNDGINIAAPRGAPVRAIDGGTVAYAGNELPGYGNLVLVKHTDGWISAYAHCEELLVKRGEPVKRGQVIAKVGATGGVSEPQLHFELRRGKKAVDPREFLAPAPSAERHEPAGAARRRG